MPLKPSRRLPKKFNRPAPKYVKRVVKKRHKKKGPSLSKLQRKLRTTQKKVSSMSKVIWRVFLTLVILGALAGSVSFFFSPFLRINTIAITQTPRLDVQEAQHVLTPLLNRHILSVTEHEVRSILQENFSDLSSVTVETRLPQTIAVTINLQDVVAKLFILEPDSTDATEPIEEQQNDEETEEGSTKRRPHSDYMTSDGVYILDALTPYPSDMTTIRIVDWGARPNPGTELLDEDIRKLLERTTRTLTQQFGHVITKRTVYLRAREVHIGTENYTLWFDLANPLEQQFQRYRTFLRVSDPSVIEEYIDLRLGDRIIYK